MKLNTRQIFAISRIIDHQNIIGYKAALTKFYYKCLDIPSISKIESLYLEASENAKKINSELEEEKQKIMIEIQSSKNKKISEKTKEKVESYNQKFKSMVFEKNSSLIIQLNEILNSNEEIEIEFNELLIKAIKNIIESEKQIDSLGLEPAVVKSLMEIYVKLD